jgi:hypothetical protein
MQVSGLYTETRKKKMKIKSIIVDDEKHGRENLAGRQTLEIRSEICT